MNNKKIKQSIVFLMILVFLLSFTTLAYVKEPYKIDGDASVFESIDDETGLASSELPIQTRQASGVIWSNIFTESGKKVIERAVATGDATLKNNS